MKTKLPKKSQTIQPLIFEFKRELQKLYGENLQQMILFGSYARGQQHEESDIDLLVLLNSTTSPYQESDFINELQTDFSFEHEIYFSVITTSVEKFNTMQNPLYYNIKKEGVIV